MAKIAILGFGTVGSGVYEVLCRNAAGVSRRAGEPVEVKYILDPKDFSGHPAAHLFVKDLTSSSKTPRSGWWWRPSAAPVLPTRM